MSLLLHPCYSRFQPILGAGISRGMTMDEFFSKTIYPVYATPKLDGIRCVLMPGSAEGGVCRPATRSLDDIPNTHIFNKLKMLPPGLDGELVTYHQKELFDKIDRACKFYQVQSHVMSEQGIPDFVFHVFDYHDWSVPHPHLETYETRLAKLDAMTLPSFCRPVIRKKCRIREEIETFEEACVKDGYEGICWRWIQSPYKYGRSTLKQQYLIKMKRFETMEAEILYAYEEMHNANPAERNAMGNLERSSHKAGMLGKNTLGGLACKAEGFELQFNIGSGFDASQRAELWSKRQFLPGRKVTFKHQPHGAKDRPRIPIFIAIRDERDL